MPLSVPVTLSLRLRLALWFGALTAAIVVIVCLYSYAVHGRTHYDTLDVMLRNAAAHIDAELSRAATDEDRARILEASRRAFPEVAVERRIEEHDVERGRRAGEPGQRVGVHDARVIDLEPRERVAQALRKSTVTFDEHAFACAARFRFDAERTGSRVEVEAACALDDRREPVEQGLAHAVTGWPQPCRIGHVEPASAQMARDNAHAAAGIACRSPGSCLHRTFRNGIQGRSDSMPAIIFVLSTL